MSALYRPLSCLLLVLLLTTSAHAAVINATFTGTFKGFVGGPGTFGDPVGWVLNAKLAGWLSIKEPTGTAYEYPPGTFAYSGYENYNGHASSIVYLASTAFTLSHPTAGTWDYFYEFPIMLLTESATTQQLALHHSFGKYHIGIDMTGPSGSLFSSADPAKFNPHPLWADMDSAFLSFSDPFMSGKGVITNMVFASPVSAPPAMALVLIALGLLGLRFRSVNAKPGTRANALLN